MFSTIIIVSIDRRKSLIKEKMHVGVDESENEVVYLSIYTCLLVVCFQTI